MIELGMEAIIEDITLFVAALAGGIAGGYFALKATDKAIKDANEKEVRREEKEVSNLLEALGVEIKTLWDFHMKRVGRKVEELAPGKALEFYYPLTQDYFTIYNANAALIGRIQNRDLREAIVVCYNKCKKVVDGFKYNNDIFRDHHELVIASDGGTRDEQYIAAKQKELVDYARVIKEDHFELKAYIDRMMKLLAEARPA